MESQSIDDGPDVTAVYSGYKVPQYLTRNGYLEMSLLRVELNITV